MTREKASINPQALRLAREQARLSQRELGRRVAERLDRADGARAVQVRLSRLEQGDEISQTDRDLLDALAAELAVGSDDLAEPLVWVWIKLHDGVPGIVEQAMRFPCYSTPEDAYQSRDWLAHASNGHFTPFQDAHLVPMRVTTLCQDTLDANYPDLTDDDRKLLIAVDPGEDVLPYYAVLNEVINSDEPEPGMLEVIVDTIEKFNLSGEIHHLYSLALRRLMRPPADPELLASWRLREQRLFDVLALNHKRTMERHDRILAGIPPDQ